jgi:hypothetical protein
LFSSNIRFLDEMIQAARICSETLAGMNSADMYPEQLEQSAKEQGRVLMMKLVDFANAVVALRFGQDERAQKALRGHLG